MSTGNSALQLRVRNAVCEECRLSSLTTSSKDVCITGVGKYPGTDIAVVTKAPVSTRIKEQLCLLLEDLDIDTSTIMWLSAIKCRVWDEEPNKTDLKACKTYLHTELEVCEPRFVLTMGNEALFSVLGKSGIMKYRSRVYEYHLKDTYNGEPTKVLATIAPQAVERNPGQRNGFLADLKMFANLVHDRTSVAYSAPEIKPVMTKSDLKQMCKDLQAAEGHSFDIETRSEHSSWLESHESSVIVSLSLTLWFSDRDEVIWAIPLCHPESPWRTRWRELLALIAKYLCRVKKNVAHNGKYDCKWLRHNGVPLVQTFDTMIAAHLLDENRPKGLKPLALILLGIPDWSIPTHDLWSVPIMDVLTYNGLDTWYTYQIYLIFKEQLLKNQRLARIFKYMLMPASNEFVDIERRGIWCDRHRLSERWRECVAKLDDIESQLLSYVPEDIPYPVNWNASNFLRWFLFDHLGLPVVERGKTKDDGSPGAPSVKESIMMFLAENPGKGGEVAKLLLSRVEWQKFNTSFFLPYSEIIDEDDRIHTSFKFYTNTGRTSSGKENDPDKISAKSQNKGMNAQQVPRDPFIRGLFGAAPGYAFVEADQSQIELRVAAFLSRCRQLMHLYQTGEDVHMAMAMRMTGKPKSQVTKEERKKAKAVNFGFLYGMGWMKFIETAWEKYQLRVNEAEAKLARKAFFAEMPELLRWHQRQRTLAMKYKRVESPMGRIRHLPDIDSPVQGVKAEAERQAINSPVQAFASDITLLAMVSLEDQFRKVGLDCHSVGTVHDAINFECKVEDLSRALPLIKNTMENLPLGRFGVDLDVPLVADLKVGKYWGDALELTEDQVYDFNPSNDLPRELILA